MNSKIELLAPAGDWEAFIAAVENGADAVYMGGKLFNARQFAGNFEPEQLKKALDYAHARGVKIYLTMNTLIADQEMREAVENAAEAYQFGIDGIIVQDLGFARVLKNIFPGLDLHASTQMTVYNLEGVRRLEQLGFRRAVLARELSLEEIRDIAKASPIEIEIFTHGALCISYSGQCLMSSIIGGRSGNRGKCAQPCRLPYELMKQRDGEMRPVRTEGKYLLSPKDLCSLEIVDKVLETGVKSLKIEGRAKNPEYVATVVGTYRKYIDRYLTSAESGRHKIEIEKSDLKSLTQIFNRGGFSKGYLQGKAGRDMMCCEKPKNWGIYLGEAVSYDKAGCKLTVRLADGLSIGDGVEIWNGEEEHPGTVVSEIRSNGKNVTSAAKGQTVTISGIRGRVSRGNKVYKTSDKQLNAAARETFSGKGRRKTAVSGLVNLKKGSPVTLKVFDALGNEVFVDSGMIPEQAVNRPLTREKVLEQMNKTGSTPFVFREIGVELDEELSIPVSVLNDIRRKALEELEQKQIHHYLKGMSDEWREKMDTVLHFPGNSRIESEKLQISILFYQWSPEIDYGALNAGRIYIPFKELLSEKAGKMARQYRSEGKEVFAWIPPITRGYYDKLIKKKLPELFHEGLDGILVGNMGSLEYVKGLKGVKTAADYSFNAFNSFTIEEIREIGVERVTLSPELTLAQIRALQYTGSFLREAIVYGRIPVMTSEYCPVGSVAGEFSSNTKCNEACKTGEYHLKDRMGMQFPVMCDRIDCRSTIFNSNVLFAPDILDKLKVSGVNIIRINFTDEEPREMDEIIDFFRDTAQNGSKALDRHKELVERIKSRGFTKGHYFRGV